jgi:Flp pilus assembly protein TadD
MNEENAMTTDQPTLTITCDVKADLAAAGLLPTHTDAYAHGTDLDMERLERAEEHLLRTYAHAWSDAAAIAGLERGYNVRALTTDSAELTDDIIHSQTDAERHEAIGIWQAAHDRIKLAIHSDGSWTLKDCDGYLINPYTGRST